MDKWEKDLKDIIKNWHLYPDNTMRFNILRVMISKLLKKEKIDE